MELLLNDGVFQTADEIPPTGSWTSWCKRNPDCCSGTRKPCRQTLVILQCDPNVDYISVQALDDNNAPTVPSLKSPMAPSFLEPVYYRPEFAESFKVKIEGKNRGEHGDNGYADYQGNGACM